MTDNTDPATSGQAPANPQIAALELDVARANRAFSASLRDVSEAGVQAAARVKGAVRPVLIGAAVLGGAFLMLQLVRRSRSARFARATPPASKRPLWAELARSAAGTLAMAGARRLALVLLNRKHPVPEPPRQIAHRS
jgi:hypothetical protein